MNRDWRATNSSWAVPLAEERDERIASDIPFESGRLIKLEVWAKNQLLAVAATGVDVRRLVRTSGRRGQERTLICGKRKEDRFIRKDGVCCNFKIVVREVDAGLELVSYVLHLDAPEDHDAPPRFLRWEYTARRKKNVDAIREPLAHLHPGHDDVRLPTPVHGPKELIAMFLGLELWP